MKIKSLTLCLAAFSFAGCTQTDLIDGSASMQGMIDYSLYTGRGTRATALDNTNFDKFKIYSYQNIEEVATPGTFAFSAYYDEVVEKSTTWAGPRPRRWPTGANDYLNFYAYSDEVNTTNYVAATAVDAHPTFTYTVPADATKQQDLLVASAFNQQEKTAQGKLNLDFKHALTQVAFKVKSASPSFTVKVSKVELIQANSSATFTYDATATVGAWSAAGTPADYAFSVETPAKVDDQNFVALAAAKGNLMMIPNADPKAVTLRVTYTLDDDDPTVLANVLVKEVPLEKESATAGSNQPATTPVTPWAMGKKITYNLTLPGRANEIIFGDATMSEDWDTTEEEVNAEAKDIFGVSFIGVDGFRNTAGFPLEINDNRQTAGTFSLSSDQAWVKFSETADDYANAKTTLTNVAPATRANAAKKVYVYTDNAGIDRTATITMTRADYSTVTIEVIQKAAEPNLAGANCFIITDANFYALDATVKGNGKQVELPAGYDAVANPATAIPVNASDVNITRATKAEVLWETVNTSSAPAKNSIVKDISFNNGVVYFNTTATQGNAVIVVKNASNTILWSWHIWRTNQQPAAKELAPITAKTGTFDIDGTSTLSGLKVMDRNLGALSAAPQSDLSGGLVYQWGRPVPFPGSINLTSGSTTVMAITGTSVTTWAGDNAMSPATAEANPNAFYTSASGNYDWASRNDNLWGTPLTNKVVVNNGTDKSFNSNAGSKTIYDPCPRGWRMAPNYAFANASTTTSTTFDKGRELSILTTADKLWFPAFGLRSNGDGILNSVGANGYYWFSSPYVANTARGGFLFFDSSNVYPSDGNYRAYGLPCRCVQE